MSNILPDFGAHGYDATALLGRNLAAGRSTWRATRAADGVEVVIKRFSFAATDASWEAFRDHEREIAVLRELDHPGIPRFLDAFQTTDGFCLVQSFVAGRPLGERGSFSLPEVLDIARKVLKILIYLQQRVPPVVHRDLKPDNILRDDRGRVWLVDFGLARAQHESTSTLAVGTPGFMPPEQVLGRALGPAADLYGLGATLIACLTGRRGSELGDLVDTSFRFDLSRLPQLPEALTAWLTRLVEPAASDRYPSAGAALSVLAAAERGDGLATSEPLTMFARPPTARRTIPFAAIFVVVALTGIAATSFIVATPQLTPAPSPNAEDLGDRLPGPRDPSHGLPIGQGDPNVAPAPRELPLRCDGPLARSAHTFTLAADEPPLVAGAGCDLTLTDVRISAEGRILELKDGARVRLVRSELTNTKRDAVVSIAGHATILEAESTTLAAVKGLALEIRDGAASLTGGRITTRGPEVARVMQQGLATFEATTVEGQIATHHGYVLGLDPAADAETRKALRDDHFESGACAGLEACLEASGYFGTLEFQVIGRLTKGVVDKVRVVDATNGRVDRSFRACLEQAGASRPAPVEPPRGGGPAPSELPLAYRGCSVTGQMNGGTRMLNVSRFFFVADESPENAKKMRRVFR